MVKISHGSIMHKIKRLVLVLLVFFATAMILDLTTRKETQLTDEEAQLYYAYNIPAPHLTDPDVNWRHIPEEKKTNFSKLGKILFFDDKIPKPNSGKNYIILVWKYGPSIEKRHIYHYTQTRHDPFEECTVKNCRLTYNSEDLNVADLVIIHLHRTKGLEDLPPTTTRPYHQRWAFLTDESPYHTFLSSKNTLKDYNGLFNWSMTYRMNSDIPVPYGRTTLRRTVNNIDLATKFFEWRKKKRQDVLIAIMGSNCGSKNHRWEYVRELGKHIKVDSYGACGNLKCEGHFGNDCPKLNDYMFYLSFENSNCKEYITEKLWWNAFHKDSIPIVMGANKHSYAELLPPGSYINVEDFASPQALADYIKYLSRAPEHLIKYFFWQKNYEIHNEHGYFKSKSYHYCRACEALNYNENHKKTYEDLERFWSVKNDCYPSWDFKGND